MNLQLFSVSAGTWALGILQRYMNESWYCPGNDYAFLTLGSNYLPSFTVSATDELLEKESVPPV